MDEGELENICKQVIEENVNIVEQYKKGKLTVM
ncbi:MAG: hypothetical protein WCG98_08595 [bacterium]